MCAIQRPVHGCCHVVCNEHAAILRTLKQQKDLQLTSSGATPSPETNVGKNVDGSNDSDDVSGERRKGRNEDDGQRKAVEVAARGTCSVGAATQATASLTSTRGKEGCVKLRS